MLKTVCLNGGLKGRLQGEATSRNLSGILYLFGRRNCYRYFSVVLHWLIDYIYFSPRASHQVEIVDLFELCP